MRWLYLIVSSVAIAALLILLLQTATPTPADSVPFTPAKPVVMTEEMKGLLEQSQNLAKSGDLVEAFRTLKKLKAIEPRLKEAYLEEGQIYLKANQYEQAAVEWKNGLEKCGESSDLLIALGLLFLQAKSDPLTAMMFFKRAEKLDPNTKGLKEAMAETFAITAEMLLRKGDRVKAKEALAQAMSFQPTSARALRIRADIAESENRWEEATADREKIFSTAPDVESRRSLAEAHKRSGFIQLAKKDREAAILHFRRTVDLAADGVSLDSLIDLLQQESQTALEEGVKYFEAKEYTKAKERFSYSASLLPENPIAHNHLGLVLLKEGDKEGAVQAWETAILQAQKAGYELGSSPTHKNLAILYRDLKQNEKSQGIASDYLKKFPNGPYAEELKKLANPQ